MAADLIEQELALTTAALEANERSFLTENEDEEESETIAQRLQRLQQETEQIAMMQELVCYGKATDDREKLQLLSKFFMVRSPRTTTTKLYWELYEREFLPLAEHHTESLVRRLQNLLRDAEYPQEAATLLQDESLCETVESAIHDITKLLEWRRATTAHMEGASPTTIHPVVVELLRPFAERIRYFFVQESDRPTNAKIDRLPEWLLSYIKTNLLAAAPWQFMCHVVGNNDSLVLECVNEIIRLIQYVLAERNFFRHPKIMATSMLLSNAIEQLLQFDQYVVDTLLLSQARRVVSLIDVCVAGDEELLAWWLERERESVFALLNSEDIGEAEQLVAPRAELFCSILRSLQKKATVFTFSQPYLSQVAAPLCVQFLDALHESSADLRKILTKRSVPSDATFTDTIRKWLGLINGAHMAVSMLLEFSDDDDMVRLGRSLERLRGAMMDDFVTDLVEVVLMERAKLAGYLMRCSHILSMDESEVDDYSNVYGISVDLIETKRILALILLVCDEYRHGDGVASYAPKAVYDRVLSVLAEKFLEVALDFQGMTPDLRRPGCALFARDVRALFGESASLPNHPKRVIDIASLMESKDLAALGNILCNLCGRPAPLTESIFEADSRLYEEARSMIQAKGHVYVELADVFAILNRRRDL